MVVNAPELRTIYLGMDQTSDELRGSNVKGKNPFKDVRVREAFFRAIDEDAIVKRVMRGQATPAGPADRPAALPARRRVQAPAYDPNKAKALLAEGRLSQRLRGAAGLPERPLRQRRGDLPAVTSMLARVGVKVNLIAQPKAKYFAKILKPAFDTSFYMLGWTPSSMDSHNILYEIAGCRTDKSSPRGTTNLGNYCNPKVDALADKIERETDQAARNQMIKQAYEIVMNDWGYIPLHQQALAWGVSKKVKLVPRADNQMMLYWVSKEQ